MDLKEAARFSNATRHPWESARLAIIVKGVRRILAETGKQSLNVLDIGSGDMYVVSELAKAFPGLRFFAVDNRFTPEIMESFAPMLKGLPVQMHPTLESAREAMQGPADLITLFDVVEHIDDDLGFLKSLHSLGMTGPGTRMYITVPSYQALFCSHDVFLEHFRRHTRGTIRKVTTAAGFRFEYSGYFFGILIPPRILTVIREKITGPPKSDGTGLSEWKGSPFLTRLIRGVLMTDYAIGAAFRSIRIHLPGLSTFIVCSTSA